MATNKLQANNGKFANFWFSKSTLVALTGNENYLEKVVRDAYIAERKPVPVDLLKGFNTWDLDGKTYISVDGNFSPFARVTRRVNFRLDNNKWIEKKEVKIHTEYVYNAHGYVDHTEYYMEEAI